MGKLHLAFSANTFHSNLLQKNWEEMNKEEGGLDIIGKSGIPVSVSYQGIDLELLPWLKNIEKYSNIKHISAPHGHTLFNLINANDKFALQDGLVQGNVPITFFPEFCTPEDTNRIPTEFFWVLEGQTYLYSLYDLHSDVAPEKFPPDALGIKHGDKIGIIMRDFEPLLKEFFIFQREPRNPEKLENLLAEIKRIGNMPDEVLVVCPLDLEAPFIGSLFGEDVWNIFFKEIKERGLESVFTPIEETLDDIKERSVEAPAPHRSLVKWATYDIQMRYWMQLSQIKPVTQREQILYSICSASDILSAWERKIGGSKKEILLPAKNKIGADVKIPILFNQEVIDVQILALSAITEGTVFQKKLGELNKNSLFIQRMKKFAEKYDL